MPRYRFSLVSRVSCLVLSVSSPASSQSFSLSLCLFPVRSLRYLTFRFDVLGRPFLEVQPALHVYKRSRICLLKCRLPLASTRNAVWLLPLLVQALRLQDSTPVSAIKACPRSLDKAKIPLSLSRGLSVCWISPRLVALLSTLSHSDLPCVLTSAGFLSRFSNKTIVWGG
jgi:hypothetical protein